MNEQEYEEFKQARLNGYTIREIATTNNHGHHYYHKNGYVDCFKHEYPNFPETRGKGKRGQATQKEASTYLNMDEVEYKQFEQARTYPNMDEQEYRDFESKRLAGMPMADIIYKSSHSNNYFYMNGYVDRFNREHPEFKHNTKLANQLLTEDQIYNDYIEYHRKGMAIDDISKRLGISVSRIKQAITVHENKSLIQQADHTLANQVQQAKRADKFKILDKFMRELIADYGKTLMDVPNDEPRLLALQLANRTLK
ncbi:hypothetical protein [Weissella viridescens]|uniref:hypothetical protein n=1 Tax=Weissella viridescens TaxID=1629 RepID=UPI003AF1ED76